MNVLTFLLPEIILVILSFALLANSIVNYKRKIMANKTMILVGIIASGFFILKTPEGFYLNSTFENTSSTKIIKLLLIFGSLFSLSLISNSKTDQLKNI